MVRQVRPEILKHHLKWLYIWRSGGGHSLIHKFIQKFLYLSKKSLSLYIHIHIYVYISLNAENFEKHRSVKFIITLFYIMIENKQCIYEVETQRQTLEKWENG
jgi:hypothetical protein